MSAGWRRPRLLAVWLLLLGLMAAIALIEGTRLFERQAPPPDSNLPMFAFGEPELAAVEVLYRGKFAALLRDPEGQWFAHDNSHRHGDGGQGGAAQAGPGPAAGDDHRIDPERSATIAEQLAVAARMRADRRVQPEQGLDTYGLARPQAMIAFYGRTADGTDYARPLEVLYVGDLLPDEYSYYARREDDRELSLVPRYYVVLLLALAFGDEQVPTPLPPRPGGSGS